MNQLLDMPRIKLETITTEADDPPPATVKQSSNSTKKKRSRAKVLESSNTANTLTTLTPFDVQDAPSAAKKPRPNEPDNKLVQPDELAQLPVLDQIIALEKWWPSERRRQLDTLMREQRKLQDQCKSYQHDRNLVGKYKDTRAQLSEVDERIKVLREDRDTVLLQKHKDLIQRRNAASASQTRPPTTTSHSSPTTTSVAVKVEPSLRPTVIDIAGLVSAVCSCASQASANQSANKNNVPVVDLDKQVSASNEEASAAANLPIWMDMDTGGEDGDRDDFDNSLDESQQHYSDLSSRCSIFDISNLHTSASTVANSNKNGNAKASAAEKPYFSQVLAQIQDKDALTARYAESDICPKCNSVMVDDPEENILSCTKCGYADDCLEKEVEVLGAEETDNGRESSFEKVWSIFFAKKAYVNVDEPVNACRLDLMEKGHDLSSDVTLQRVVEILKRRGLFQKFGAHRVQITSTLNGVSPPILTDDEWSILKRNFRLVKRAFSLVRDFFRRKNFIAYPFVSIKLAQIMCLKYPEFARFIPWIDKRNASRTLEEQELIWQKITQYLKWVYIYGQQCPTSLMMSTSLQLYNKQA